MSAFLPLNVAEDQIVISLFQLSFDSLRDLLHCKYRSSTRAKTFRRKRSAVQMDDDIAFILHNKDVERRMNEIKDTARRGGKIILTDTVDKVV